MANKIISELNEELWPQSDDLFVVHGSGLTKKVKLHHMMPDFYSSDTIYLNYDPSTRIFFSHLKENSVKSYHLFPLSAFEVVGSDKGIEHWLAEIYSNSLQISGLSSQQFAASELVLTNSLFWTEAYNISTVYSLASSKYEDVYTNVVSNSTAYLSAVDLSFLSVSGNWNTAYNTATDYAAISANFLTSETDSQTLLFDEVTKDLSISNGNVVSLSALLDDTGVDTGVRALTSNWESTYNTFKTLSSTFLTTETDSQTLSFNEGTKDLSISNGNIVSLSALIDLTSADTEVRALTGNWQSSYLDQSNYLPLSGGTVTGDISATGVVYVSAIDCFDGIILKSPDNTQWKITVTNTGILSTVAI